MLCASSSQYPLTSMLISTAFISTADSAPAGIAALVPVGSTPEISHKRTEPQPSCRACGTYLRGLNAPGNSLSVRPVPTPRRSASDRPLDHRALQLPRHDLAVQLAKVEVVAIGRKAQQCAASRLQRPNPPPHERPQSSAQVVTLKSHILLIIELHLAHRLIPRYRSIPSSNRFT
jgi:hypothetical protein